MSKNPQNDYKNTVFKVVSENDHSRFMNEMTQSKLFEIRITDVGFLAATNFQSCSEIFSTSAATTVGRAWSRPSFRTKEAFF